MRHASVFSGIGGPEVAAEMLGWENVFHCEINPFGRAILDYWFPNSESYEDITKTDFTKWRGQVDVLTGGFPCQPFSYAGRRRGAEDDRYLWPSMYRAIDEIQPTWVVAENVAGILTMVEQGEVSKVAGTATLFDAFDDLRGRYELRETFTLQRICTDLESHGYAVQPVLVPACAVGAGHRRNRVFIVGHRRKDTEDTPADTTEQRSERVQSEQRQDSRPTQEQSGRGSGEYDAWATSDTSDIGAGQQFASECKERGTSRVPQPGDSYCKNIPNDRDVCGAAWRDYPTQSPVHRGNDGLPFDVDRLTLSFGKWRTEALKAYGNAIVPQVMYEIFRAIEIITDKTQKP